MSHRPGRGVQSVGASVDPVPRGRRRAPLKRSLRAGAREQGAALVEFALVLPIFALMLFAMVQFGLLFTGWAELRDAVQTGARLAAVGGTGGYGAACPEVAAFPPPPTALGQQDGTASLVCELQSKLMSGLVGTNTRSAPAEVGLLVGRPGPTVRVCARLEGQSFTGFFPPMWISSISEFYVQPGSSLNISDYNPYGIVACDR